MSRIVNFSDIDAVVRSIIEIDNREVHVSHWDYIESCHVQYIHIRSFSSLLEKIPKVLQILYPDQFVSLRIIPLNPPALSVLTISVSGPFK